MDTTNANANITATNVNTRTGIPFGMILANSLHPDLVDKLLYGEGAFDMSFHAFLERTEFELREQLIGEAWPDDDFEVELERRMRREIDAYECEEPHVEGEHEGVRYESSWLGGALHFCILESPVITRCAPCSPCVPGAGDLDSVGDYECYGVPDDWRA